MPVVKIRDRLAAMWNTVHWPLWHINLLLFQNTALDSFFILVRDVGNIH